MLSHGMNLHWTFSNSFTWH